MAATEQHTHLQPPVFEMPTRVLIVVAPYYDVVAAELVAGAKSACETARCMYDLVEVPGALEIPTAIAIAARSGEYDGYVALGCVIRGETTHYETVCNDSSRGLTLLGLQGHCIGNGILTVENMDQALVRARSEEQNKGGGAAAAALHLIGLSRRFKAKPGKAPVNPRSYRIAGSPDDPTA